MDKYKAFVVDDDPQVRELLVECLRFSDFDARGYSEAEKLLSEVFDVGLECFGPPDLVVVDLQLEPGKMQGIDLVSELAERNIPSEILVISGNQPSSDLVEAIKIGAAAAVTKPFDNIFDLVRKMELLAHTGRRRRLYRLEDEPRQMDPSRLHRPVFLSYSANDQKVATGIRRNLEAKEIGVWYAPTALRVGDAWRQSVEDGIDQAAVFAALITNDYLRSPFCIGELLRFHRRVESDVKQHLVILPILAGLSEDGRRHEFVRPLLERWQHVDVSIRFIDGLTALLARIQRSVPRQTFLNWNGTRAKL